MTHPILTYIKSKGLTQKRFAECIGVREATVSSWVNGKTPKPEQMRRVAEATDGAVPVTAWFESSSPGDAA